MFYLDNPYKSLPSHTTQQIKINKKHKKIHSTKMPKLCSHGQRRETPFKIQTISS